jgi:hypothetical protein
MLPVAFTGRHSALLLSTLFFHEVGLVERRRSRGSREGRPDKAEEV